MLSAAKRALLERRLRGLADRSGKGTQFMKLPDGASPVLSPGQESLWYLHQLDPENAANHMYKAIRMSGPLNTIILGTSLNEVVRRHEVLRTRFDEVNGRPVPVVQPELVLEMPLVTVPPGPHQEAEVKALATKVVQQPFDLADGPLIRCLLIRLSESNHVFVLVLHHIISDEWSLGVFWKELARYYAGLQADPAFTLPELPFQYPDFARWQHQRLETGQMDRHLAYWTQKLSGDLPRVVLPADHQPFGANNRGALRSLPLPAALAEKIRLLAARQEVTRFTVYLAAFEVLLNRYSGLTDLIVGTPVTNRNSLESEGLIGFFINTLVLRFDLSDDPTFIEALSRTRSVVLEALAHQELPFEKLVDALKPERLPGQNPLFQMMFVYQQETIPANLTDDLLIRPFPVENGASKFDLTLFVTEENEKVTLTIEYRRDLFEAATIDRMLRNLQVLLEGIVADPERPISTLPILSETERRILLKDWNGTEIEAPPYKAVHHFFEAQAAQTPDRTAVVFEDRSLTYGELDQRANQLASVLREVGVGPNVCVGLYVERSVEMIVGMLGILKAGGAYVPLDPAYPSARLRFMLDDSDAPVVLATLTPGPDLTYGGLRIILFESLDSSGEVAWNEKVDVSGDHLAYVIYTSGSTGQPKGVPVTHRNLTYSTFARLKYYPESPASFLLLSSFSFDSAVAGIFWTLSTGGTLILPRQRLEQDIDQLADLIAAQKVTHTLCLPSLYSLLLEHAGADQLASLKTVIVAGEACPVSLARAHYDRLPGCVLYNEYGPTEATVWSTVYKVPPGSEGARLPIGRPIPGVRVYVLDSHLNPVPIGVVGELFVGGEGVTGRYQNREELTAERFIPDPYVEGGRLYRTGDLARFLSDGTIEFLGRVDLQVKIRGYRIEPGEIESILSRHPAIRECVVVARSDGKGRGTSHEGEEVLDTGFLLGKLRALDAREAERLLSEVEQA